jgi:hypothetical protein
MTSESPTREESPPVEHGNGRALERERSRSPVRDRERHRERSPVSKSSVGDHERRQHHHQHHHHQGRHHHYRTGYRSPDKEKARGGDQDRRRDRSATPERKKPYEPDESNNGQEKKVPTGPRGYRSAQHYRPERKYERREEDRRDERRDERRDGSYGRRESNFGRLGYVDSYDDYEDERDDEDRLREVERGREEDREKEEPTVIFKGRGVMKYREHHHH